MPNSIGSYASGKVKVVTRVVCDATIFRKPRREKIVKEH